MANITYRVSNNPTIPGASTVKGTALTNLEIDANFKAVDNEVQTLTTTVSTKASSEDVLALAIALG